MNGGLVSYYTFNPDQVASFLERGDWAGCWDYLTEMLKSFSSVFTATADALARWEPRFELTRVRITAARVGQLVLDLEGRYRPDGEVMVIAVEL